MPVTVPPLQSCRKIDDRILNLFTSYRWKAHATKKAVESTTESQREAATRQAMHRRRKCRRDQRVASVVVGRRCRYANRSVTDAAAAPQSVDASFTLNRSEMKAAPSPSRSA